jgi:hypothetical protein
MAVERVYLIYKVGEENSVIGTRNEDIAEEICVILKDEDKYCGLHSNYVYNSVNLIDTVEELDSFL